MNARRSKSLRDCDIDSEGWGRISSHICPVSCEQLQLQHTFRLDRERPHALSGLHARLAAKIALHNFCIWVNEQLGRPRLAFADLVAW